MVINNTLFNCELSEILIELQKQLRLNNIQYLQTIKDSGQDVMCTCPYHNNGQERRPSAGIRKSDGKFHCFTCNNTHELPEVISYCLGYYNDELGIEGWKWLSKNFLSLSVENRKEIQLNLERQEKKQKQEYISEDELEKYRYIHPYMYKRKLTDEIIELFDIGYDKETDCITFPIQDERGNVLYIARRSTRTKYFNYPKAVNKPVYGVYQINQLKEKPKEIIVCESMIDVLTIWGWGKYAVALNGTGSYTQYKLLEELPCRTLILGTDSDEAGMKERKKIKENVKGKIIKQYKDYFGKKDINELTKEEFDNLKVIF